MSGAEVPLRRLRWTITTHPPFSVLTIVGEVDRDALLLDRDDLLYSLMTAAPARLVVDLTGATFLDPRGVRLLLTLQRVFGPGEPLRVVTAPGLLRQMLNSAELDARFDVHLALGAALDAF